MAHKDKLAVSVALSAAAVEARAGRFCLGQADRKTQQEVPCVIVPVRQIAKLYTLQTRLGRLYAEPGARGRTVDARKKPEAIHVSGDCVKAFREIRLARARVDRFAVARQWRGGGRGLNLVARD